MLSRIVSVGWVVLLLAACASGPAKLPQYPLPEHWSQQPVRLDALSVRVVDDYEMTLKPPYVEHQFPVSFEQAMEHWAETRLNTNGRDEYQLEIHLDKALAMEQSLPRTKGVKGVFTTDQASSFETWLQVTLKMYGPESFLPESEIIVSVARKLSLPEGATLEEREALYHQLLVETMEMFDKEAMKQIHKRFAKYILVPEAAE